MESTNEMMSRRAFVRISTAALTSLALAGCAQAPEEASHQRTTEGNEISGPEASPQEAAQGERTTGNGVVAVFSRTGNTLALAEAVQDRTGLSLVRIEPGEPYPQDYDEMLAVGQREQDEDSRPALADDTPSLAAYDTVYLGFPVWWGRIPQIVKTLADRGDLAGKTIAPFCTSGSSSIAASVSDLRSLCPDATVLDGLTVTEAELSTMDASAEAWLAALGL